MYIAGVLLRFVAGRLSRLRKQRDGLQLLSMLHARFMIPGQNPARQISARLNIRNRCGFTESLTAADNDVLYIKNNSGFSAIIEREKGNKLRNGMLPYC